MNIKRTITGALALTSLAIAVAPTAALAQGNTIVFDNVGGWTVRTDPAHEYRCFIEADYDNGSSVRAGFNTDSGNFYITVADYRWEWIELGVPYVVSLQFDEEPAQNFDATGVVLETQYVQPGLRIELPQEFEDSVVARFMHLAEMHLAHEEEGAELTLGLFGTQRAVESLDGCQIRMAQTAESTEFSALQ